MENFRKTHTYLVSLVLTVKHVGCWNLNSIKDPVIFDTWTMGLRINSIHLPLLKFNPGLSLGDSLYLFNMQIRMKRSWKDVVFFSLKLKQVYIHQRSIIYSNYLMGKTLRNIIWSLNLLHHDYVLNDLAWLIILL